MAIGATGADLKKGRWSVAGRPLVCSVHGCSGRDAWFVESCAALDADGFNQRVRSLARHHNGANGDPRRATAWLDREPTLAEWNATLAVLCALDVHAPDPQSGASRRVVPHLLSDALGKRVTYTSHSLKMLKPCLYSAERELAARARAHARIPASRPLATRRHRRRSHRTPAVLHTDYAVEPGAHSGSQLERMSVAGATALARSIRPRGLAVALRYARAARSQTILEIDHMAYAVYRAWVAHVGLRGMPRVDGWAALSRWASACASSGVAPTGGAASLLPMAASHPEPPPQPPAAAGADEDSSDELDLDLDEIENDE